MQKVTLQLVDELVMEKDNKKDLQLFLYNIFEDINNFEIYSRFIFPHAFTKPFAGFHNELVKDFMADGHCADGAPRGHGKSSIIGLAYVSWLLAYQKEKYIIYTSQNHAKSTQFLEPLIMELKNNIMFNFIYGNITPKKVVEGGKDRQDMIDVRGIRVHALSFEKNIRGLKYGVTRPTLIIFDDIEDDQRVNNPDLRRKDADKINKQIIPALDPVVGRIKMVGTILHHDSQLARRIRLFNGKIFRAITNGKPLWSDMYDLDRLEKIKKTIGSASFESEYMNNPVDDSASIIKREWVRQCFDESLSFFEPFDKFDYKFLGVDFAFSDRVTADKSAFVGVGKVSNNYTIIECITRKGLSVTQQFDYIERITGENDYQEAALEENSIRSMSKELKNYNFNYTLFWTGATDEKANKPTKTIDPEFDDKRHTIGKIAMIDRLATQFENGRIRIPYKTDKDKEIANTILDECCTFARQDGKLVEVGVHGDIPIALAYAIERAELDKFEFISGVLE